MTQILIPPFQFVLLIEDSNGNEIEKETVDFYTLQNLQKVVNEDDLQMIVTLKDPYDGEIATNKAGYWTEADITNLQIKIPISVNNGKVILTANVPSFTAINQFGNYVANYDNFCEFTFTKEGLVGSPEFSDNNQYNDPYNYIGVQQIAQVEYICGVASLKVDTLFDLDFKVSNLTSGSFIFKSDKKQIEVQSAIFNDTVTVEADNNKYGIEGSEYEGNDSKNDGDELIHASLSHEDTKLKDIKILGDTIDFTIKAFNINGRNAEE